MIYGQCIGCRRKKWFVRQRSYIVPNISGPITSDGDLCLSCFDTIKQMTLGIPKNRFKRLARWVHGRILSL